MDKPDAQDKNPGPWGGGTASLSIVLIYVKSFVKIFVPCAETAG
jgi:hypothetical protein